MNRKIENATFPELAYLLGGYLNDQSEDIEESLQGYFIANGVQRASQVISEITRLLKEDYSEEAITDFITNLCIHLLDEGGKATLELIRDELTRLIKEVTG